MECSKADGLIMKYMDNTISANEAKALNAHLALCEKCMSDFLAYDEIMSEFSELELVSPMDGFETAVMAKIEECGVIYEKRTSLLDNIITVIIGFASVLLGIGFLFAINRDQIIDYLESASFIGSYVSFMKPMLNLITEYSNSFINVVTTFALNCARFMSDYKYGILIAFIAILAIQFIRKKDKVEA